MSRRFPESARDPSRRAISERLSLGCARSPQLRQHVDRGEESGRFHRTGADPGVPRLESHLLFEHHFCHVGRGNKKGHIENFVGYSRRNFLVPVPPSDTFCVSSSGCLTSAWLVSSARSTTNYPSLVSTSPLTALRPSRLRQRATLRVQGWTRAPGVLRPRRVEGSRFGHLHPRERRVQWLQGPRHRVHHEGPSRRVADRDGQGPRGRPRDRSVRLPGGPRLRACRLRQRRAYDDTSIDDACAARASVRSLLCARRLQ